MKFDYQIRNTVRTAIRFDYQANHKSISPAVQDTVKYSMCLLLSISANIENVIKN